MPRVKVPTSKKLAEHLWEKLYARNLKGPRTWTRYMKQCICECLGRVRCDAFPHRKSGHKEYLVDVVLKRRHTKRSGPFVHDGIMVAAECEWNPTEDSLEYDFCKLADVRADKKIFIGGVSAKKWERRHHLIISPMNEHLRKHRHVASGEEYIVFLNDYGRTRGGHVDVWILKKGRTPVKVIDGEARDAKKKARR